MLLLLSIYCKTRPPEIWSPLSHPTDDSLSIRSAVDSSDTDDLKVITLAILINLEILSISYQLLVKSWFDMHNDELISTFLQNMIYQIRFGYGFGGYWIWHQQGRTLPSHFSFQQPCKHYPKCFLSKGIFTYSFTKYFPLINCLSGGILLFKYPVVVLSPSSSFINKTFWHLKSLWRWKSWHLLTPCWKKVVANFDHFFTSNSCSNRVLPLRPVKKNCFNHFQLSWTHFSILATCEVWLCCL